jgi:hypothetical protein
VLACARSAGLKQGAGARRGESAPCCLPTPTRERSSADPGVDRLALALAVSARAFPRAPRRRLPRLMFPASLTAGAIPHVRIHHSASLPRAAPARAVAPPRSSSCQKRLASTEGRYAGYARLAHRRAYGRRARRGSGSSRLRVFIASSAPSRSPRAGHVLSSSTFDELRPAR